MKTLMSCLLFTGLTMSGVAQTITPSVDDASRVKSMHILQTTVSQTQPGGSILMPPRCDQSGNLYLRFYHQQSPLLEPVYKLNANGEQQVIYSLASDPDFVGKGTVEMSLRWIMRIPAETDQHSWVIPITVPA